MVALAVDHTTEAALRHQGRCGHQQKAESATARLPSPSSTSGGRRVWSSLGLKETTSLEQSSG